MRCCVEEPANEKRRSPSSSTTPLQLFSTIVRKRFSRCSSSRSRAFALGDVADERGERDVRAAAGRRERDLDRELLAGRAAGDRSRGGGAKAHGPSAAIALEERV